MEAFGVRGADERAAEADALYAAGAAAVAALADLAPGPRLAAALTKTGALVLSPRARIELVGHWERHDLAG